MDKKFIFLGMIIGSFIGGWIPSLWNASSISLQSILGSAIGAILGIYIAFKYTRNM